MSFVITFADPTSDLMTAAAVASSQEQTTAVSAVIPTQILEREEELTGEAPCTDGFALPGGLCLPRWVIGLIVLLLLAKIALSAVKIIL